MKLDFQEIPTLVQEQEAYLTQQLPAAMVSSSVAPSPANQQHAPAAAEEANDSDAGDDVMLEDDDDEMTSQKNDDEASMTSVQTAPPPAAPANTYNDGLYVVQREDGYLYILNKESVNIGCLLFIAFY